MNLSLNENIKILNDCLQQTLQTAPRSRHFDLFSFKNVDCLGISGTSSGIEGWFNIH